jgi:hypothetical protein
VGAFRETRLALAQASSHVARQIHGQHPLARPSDPRSIMTRLWPEIAPIVRSPTNPQRYPMVFLEIPEVSVGNEIRAVRSMELCALQPIRVLLRWPDSLGLSSQADGLIDIVPRYRWIDCSWRHPIIRHVGRKCGDGGQCQSKREGRGRNHHLSSHGSLKSPASPIFALCSHLRRRSHTGKFAAAISAPTINNASISM